MGHNKPAMLSLYPLLNAAIHHLPGRLLYSRFRCVWQSLLWLTMSLTVITPAHPGVFMLTENENINNPDVIVHPSGYTGKKGEVQVTVGGTARSLINKIREINQPLLNALHTWNERVSTVGNIIATSNVPDNQFDFESVLLHELGHCLGLSHPHLASESALFGEEADYTKTTKGADNDYNLHPGADGAVGSHDDQRGDDVNLHWFAIDNNNPFRIAPVVDHLTYSRDLRDLPFGHSFAANGNRKVAELLGFTSTEVVMQQGISSGEARRTLSADDVATLRLAMSGIDGIADTDDDYTVYLTPKFSDDADIILDFDSSQTAFAECRIQARELKSGHYVITEAKIFFNDNINWFFNPQPPASSPVLQIIANHTHGPLTISLHESLLLTVSLLQIPESFVHHPADYWLRAETPIGEFWLNDRFEFVSPGQPVRAYGGPLILLDRFHILNGPISELPVGDYRLTFAVDSNQNGIFEGNFQKSIDITITP